MAVQSRQQWQEEAYLKANPDVRIAVTAGVLPDGYYHWITNGQFEGRPGSSLDRSETTQTRLCLDPWENAEFSAKGNVKPCCKIAGMENLDDWDSLEDLRNSEKFRDLRHGLLTGNLHETCRTCHIREMVPVRQQVQRVFNLVGEAVPMLEAAPLWTAQVDINTNCNLRCVYCAVSQPSYQGCQMQDDQMDKLAQLLIGYPNLAAVGVNGHGETTHHPRWKEFCRPMLTKNIPLTIITNLGKKYEADDFEVLSRFKNIQISVDTADEKLLRDIRRKVELSRILYNIAMIRTHALLDGRTPPKISFSCGLYDQSILRVEEFAWFAMAQGVSEITFWNLVKYPDVPDAAQVRTLESLDNEALAEGIRCFDRAMAVFDRFKITVEVAGGFIEELRSRLELQTQTASQGEPVA